MKMSIKKKLTIIFVLSGFIPMLVIEIASSTYARAELENSYLSKVDVMGKTKIKEIGDYFAFQQKLVQSLSINPNVVSGLKRMSKSFYMIESDAKSETFKLNASLDNYYRNEFSKAYKEKSEGGNVNSASFWSAGTKLESKNLRA